ncbi:MAG: fumarate reductase subunit FrdD [Burkholderiales bacterium]|nr:fumarate reductase subunit FrdD [Burkholderiales bacterium]
MKRSSAPIFWSMFGAGGLLSALVGPALVYLTGIAAPLSWGVPLDLMSYPRMLAFAQHWAGKAVVFLVVALFLWHAAHRIYHTLHDLGLHSKALGQWIVYGPSALLTAWLAWALLSIGF